MSFSKSSSIKLDPALFYKADEQNVVLLDMLSVYKKRLEDMSDDELYDAVVFLHQIRKVKVRKRKSDPLNDILKQIDVTMAQKIVDKIEKIEKIKQSEQSEQSD